jgi:ArsR family transcriptional regulator
MGSVSQWIDYVDNRVVNYIKTGMVDVWLKMDKTLKILKALSDGTRLKIVEFLLDGEKCVCEIFPHVKRTQSTTSIQLKNLKKAGILKSRREGKKMFYSVKDMRACDMFKALGNKKGKILKNYCCTGECK